MAASAKQVAELLFQLRSARSPLAKVRVLQQAWQVVHALTPSDRLEVATALGFEGAESVVDRLASERGGLTPELLHDLLARAEDTDPERTRELAQQLRDPQRRKNLLERGLEEVETFLATGSWPGPQPASSAAPPPAPAAPARPVAQTSTSGSPHPPMASGPGLASPGAPPAHAGTVPGRPSPPPAPPVPMQPVPPTATAERSTPKLEREPSRPAPRPAATPQSARSSPPTVPTAEAPPSADSRSDREAAAWIADLHAAPSVLARLWILRDNLPALAGESVGAIRQVLDAFPEPWARRRAIAAMLGAGVPEALADGLKLIDDLAAPHDRRWCLAVLARSRELTPADLDSVVARFGTGVVGRLFASRCRTQREGRAGDERDPHTLRSRRMSPRAPR
ncbi:MAG: hypothetical protein ACM3O7_05520 [Acidobacteriota bacterium]